MDAIGERELNRGERAKRRLMVWCALVLFALGIWLLVEPAKARGAEFRPSDQDNRFLGAQVAGPGFHPGDAPRGFPLSLETPLLVDNVVAASARASMAAVPGR